MTDEYVLDLLAKTTDIEWLEHSNGGFVAVKNGITLRLTGGPNAFITQKQSRGFKQHTIYEPRGPIWKKLTSLKLLLQKLLDSAISQCREHHKEEYKERTKDELFKDLIGWLT